MGEAEIRALLARRSRALADRDAPDFLATYAPEAVIYDLAPPLAHGLDPEGVATWLASWDGPIRHEMRDVTVTVADGLALAFGLERLAGRQGGEPRDIWFRFTLVLARGDEGWRVTHEHTSVPVRKTDGRVEAATDLKPDARDHK